MTLLPLSDAETRAAIDDARERCAILLSLLPIQARGVRIQESALRAAVSGLLGVLAFGGAGLLLLPSWGLLVGALTAAGAVFMIADAARSWIKGRSYVAGLGGHLPEHDLPALLDAGARLPQAPLLGADDLVLAIGEGPLTAGLSGTAHQRMAHLDDLAAGRIDPAWAAWIADARPGTALLRTDGALLVLGPQGPIAARPAPLETR